ncbi:MAG: LPS export ABC transporter periplasmic protein LptC [Pseudomonadota bacterium]|nr:LPS export ABC transporter periplasmic protein LptC [Pseudomonadota bacterium]MED5502511.1 LPS export ABC transporter periplasmic protein LptC [Pseudomonadota bacterium]
MISQVNNFLTKISGRNIILISCLLILFIIINNILSNALDYNSLNKNSDVSNHFLNNFEMSETDINGNIAWTLKGDRLEKFPNSARSEVLNPLMHIISSKDSFWIIESKHALDPDSLFKTIYLTGNVIFNKYDNNQINEVKIVTTEAIIYPDDEIIETDKFATIVTPNSKTSGNGVIANMKKGQIKILSNAKRLSVSDDRTEQLEGERMLYDLKKKTWVLLKKEMQNDKIKIKDRVKTILRTRKAE